MGRKKELGPEAGMAEGVHPALEAGCGVGAYQWWPAEDRLAWSPGLLDIYGLKRAPAAERSFTRLVHPEDQVCVEAETSAFLGSGATSYSHSFRIVRPDGAVRVILDRGTIERDASGAVRVIRGLNIDLTDFPHLDQASIEDRRLENAREVAGRQEAEQRLLERNRQLDLLSRTSQRLLLDAGPEQELLRAILADIAEQIGADSFYHYRPFEPALLGLEIAAGVGEEELKSVAVVKYGELLCGRVAETGTALIVEDLQNVSEPGADGLKAWGAASYAGFPVIAGGKLIGTLAFVSQTRTHFRDDEIRTIQSICNQIAITLERRRLQRELRVSERRFKLALAGSPITLFEHDLELRYQWLFNAKLGYSDSFAIGKTDHDIMDPAAAEMLTALKRQVLESGASARQNVIAAAPGQPLEYYDLYIHPRRDEAGRVIGLTCVSTDITERKAAEERQRAANDTFHQLVDRSPFGVYAIDADFRLVKVSDGAQNVFENVRPLIGRDFAEVLRIIWPEPFATEAIERFRHTLSTGEPFHAPSTVERRQDIEATEAYDWKIERVALPDGRPGVVCHFYDLSERQRHEEQIQLLMRELDHRSKNMLGLVLSIARQTASTGARDFIERFEERVQSLAAAQDVLVRSNWKAVPIADLVRSQLSHFEDLIDTRIALTGPPLALTLAASQSLGMALHELATNAAKYGALSDQHGDVAIDWRVDADGAARPRFTISWVEQGGPPVRAPQRRGFGTTVTSHMVEFSLGGEVAMDYAPDGVRWRLVCDADGILEGRSAPPRSGLPPARAAGGRIGSPAGSACWWSRTSR